MLGVQVFRMSIQKWASAAPGSSRRVRGGDGRRVNAFGSMQQNVHSESLSAPQVQCAHQTMNAIQSHNASLQ